jgi:hypothetical protein
LTCCAKWASADDAYILLDIGYMMLHFPVRVDSFVANMMLQIVILADGKDLDQSVISVSVLNDDSVEMPGEWKEERTIPLFLSSSSSYHATFSITFSSPSHSLLRFLTFGLLILSSYLLVFTAIKPLGVVPDVLMLPLRKWINKIVHQNINDLLGPPQCLSFSLRELKLDSSYSSLVLSFSSSRPCHFFECFGTHFSSSNRGRPNC